MSTEVNEETVKIKTEPREKLKVFINRARNVSAVVGVVAVVTVVASAIARRKAVAVVAVTLPDIEILKPTGVTDAASNN